MRNIRKCNKTGMRKLMVDRFNINLTIFLSFLTIVLSFSVSCLALPTSPDQAKKVVRNWIAIDNQPLDASIGTSIKEVVTFKDNNNEPLYHVVYMEPHGFIIVAGDDLVEPIVAFVPQGITYSASLDNPLGALVSQDVVGRVEYARNLTRSGQSAMSSAQQTLQSKAKRKWSLLLQQSGQAGVKFGEPTISDVRVAPFLLTKWNQTTESGGEQCYNLFTPNNYPSGCVATAMAQVMRYFQHPTTPVGTPSFTIYVDGISRSEALSGGNGSGGPYPWVAMDYGPEVSNFQRRQAIGVLMHDTGTSVNMNYTASGSGSDTLVIADRLKNPFHYTNAIKGWNDGKNIESSDLYKMMAPNLDAGYPVILGVTGSYGGHAIVADGYGYHLYIRYYHLNMGWGGAEDAWYLLPTIDSDISFNSIYKVVYNMYTNGSGEIISGRVRDRYLNPIEGVTVTVEKEGVGSKSDITDGNGIFGISKLPSDSEYTVTASKEGYLFEPENVTTLISADGLRVGNVASVDFYEATPPTVHLPTPEDEAIVSPGSAGQVLIVNSFRATSGTFFYDDDSDISHSVAATLNGGYLEATIPYGIGMNDNGKNYWYVEASNFGGTTRYPASGNLSFRVVSPPSVSDSYPEDGATISAGRTGQLLRVLAPNAYSGTFYYSDKPHGFKSAIAVVNEDYLEVTISYAEGKMNINGTNYWYMEATNRGGTTRFPESGHLSFTVENPPVVSNPNPTGSTSVGIGASGQLLRVLALGATSGTIHYGTDSDVRFSTTAKKIGDYLEATVPYSTGEMNDNGINYWYVEAQNSVGTTRYPSHGNLSFTVDSSVGSPTISKPFPEAEATVSAGLYGQLLKVYAPGAISGTFTFDEAESLCYRRQAIVNGDYLEITIPYAINMMTDDGTNYWYVTAVNSAGTTRFPENGSLSFTVSPVAQPILLDPNPVDGAIMIRDGSAHLLRVVAAGATSGTIHFDVDTDISFSVPATVNRNYLEAIIPYEVGKLHDSGLNYWYVEGSNKAGTTRYPVNGNLSFKVVSPPVVSDPNPVDGSLVEAGEEGQLLKVLAPNATSGIIYYDVDTDINFSVNASVNGEYLEAMIPYATGEMSNHGTNYWFVEATNIAGTTRYPESGSLLFNVEQNETVWTSLLPVIASSSNQQFERVAGLWDRYYDWSCDGSLGTVVDQINKNKTFTTSSAQQGSYSLHGSQFLYKYPSGTQYQGTLNQNSDSMSGTMLNSSGVTGCWSAHRREKEKQSVQSGSIDNTSIEPLSDNGH